MSLTIKDPLFFKPDLRSTIERTIQVLSSRGQLVMALAVVLGVVSSFWGEIVFPALVGGAGDDNLLALVADRVVGTAILLLVGSVMAQITFDALRNRRSEVDADFLKGTFLRVPLAIIAHISASIVIAAAVCFFFVPGLFVLPAFCLMTHVAFFEGRAEFGRSLELADGYRPQLLGLYVVAGLLMVVAVIPLLSLTPWLGAPISTFLGSLVMVAFISALTVYYHDLRWIRDELPDPDDDGSEAHHDQDSLSMPLESPA